LAGAVNVMVAWPLPPVALIEVGASGMVEGVTELLVPEMVLVPTALVAVTVNVYVVPLLNPVIVIGEFPPVAVKPPEFDVTV